MTDPLDFPLPQTTIVKPILTTEHYFEVTAGPRRTSQSIAVPVGVHQVIVDAQVPVGEIRIGLRLSHDEVVSFPIEYTTIMGSRMILAKIVIDTPLAWMAIRGTASTNAVGVARVGMTLIQTGMT